MKIYINLLKQRLIDDKNIIFFLLITGIVLFFLINKYWISPDEYIYVSVGRSIAAGLQSRSCLDCIDTAHTPLLPFIISIGYIFLHEDSIIFYRIISVIFTLGTLYLFFKILNVLVINKKVALLTLFGIFLFPGFFTFVEKVNLDILSLFFTTLVIYLLVKREKYWKVALALIFVFLSKEYTVLFSALVISAIIFLDEIYRKNSSFLQKIISIVVNHLIVFLPLVMVVFLFIVPSVLPYPRMVENLFLETIGDKYFYYGQQIRVILNIPSPNIGTPSNPSLITSIVSANFANFFVKESLFEKIKQLYISCFHESDVNIIVIPLVFTGLLIRLRLIFRSVWRNYTVIRNDAIFLMFMLIILFFNYRVALDDHGFRIVFPIIIPFLYFTYHACVSIIKRNKALTKIIFILLFVLFSILYVNTSNTPADTNGLLSNYPVVQLFSSYKVYFNLILYSAIALFILFINRLDYKYKYHALALLLAVACIYKVLPFAVDKSLSLKKYGQDYDLMYARPQLESIEKTHPKVLTNLGEYQYYYYSNSIKLPNIDRSIFPIIRRQPSEVYPDRLVLFNLSQDTVNSRYLCQKDVDYVFYLRTDKDSSLFYQKIQTMQLATIVLEYYHSENQRYNWGLYKVNKNLCPKIFKPI